MKFVKILLISLILPGLSLFAWAAAQPARAGELAQGDNPESFDDDNFADLAIGVYDEDTTPGMTTILNSGVVQVVYGSQSTGLTGAGDQYWFQGDSGVAGTLEADDQFGRALAICDFNGDSFDDLAVGVPGQTVDTHPGAGQVHVFYGDETGLRTTNQQRWDQSGDIVGGPENDDHFGRSLSAGDFDRDGYCDLAVGVPYEDWDAVDAGMVNVIYGSNGGLTAAGNARFGPEYDGVVGIQETNDRFGLGLETGDFNGDGYDDLAVGSPWEDLGGEPQIPEAGAVNLLYGSAGGLTGASSDYFHQGMSFIDGELGEGELFGYALAAGDYDNDGCDDLAIGVIGQTVDGNGDAGMAHILWGSETMSSDIDFDDLVLDALELGLIASDNTQMGYTLESSDFNADGYADLAFGTPYGDWNVANAGGVMIVYGSRFWGYSYTFMTLHEGYEGMPDAWEIDDNFGMALAAGNYNGDGYADLVIGAPFEDLGAGPTADTGAIFLVYGTKDGITTTGSAMFAQGILDIQGTQELNDHFGMVLEAHEFFIEKMFLPLILQ